MKKPFTRPLGLFSTLALACLLFTGCTPGSNSDSSHSPSASPTKIFLEDLLGTPQASIEHEATMLHIAHSPQLNAPTQSAEFL